ncbi:MAG TPA: hypothetical protein DDZ89_10755 [Clostridiales bacterium]|nr:hypothetical protein [Clostridiales bacterium]
MKRSKLIGGSLIAILIVLAYVMPYTVFSDVNAWYGSFLWWSLTALAVITITFFMTRDWSR